MLWTVLDFVQLALVLFGYWCVYRAGWYRGGMDCRQKWFAQGHQVGYCEATQDTAVQRLEKLEQILLSSGAMTQEQINEMREAINGVSRP